MQLVRTRYHSFEEFRDAEHSSGSGRHGARQLMMMYRAAAGVRNPVILELGTARGASTTVFLQACEEADGRLVSVDVEDCSDVAESPRWRFVQGDSTRVEAILTQAPHLRDGIDLLYVDSLHRRAHVEKELTGWYPFLKEGAHVFFDDVDSTPYRDGNRKDNVIAEIAFDEIREYVEEFFASNESDTTLEILFGSTGLAHLQKLSPRGSLPRPARRSRHRRRGITALLHYPKLIGKWLDRTRRAR